MEGVGDQGDDKITSADLGIKSRLVGDIEGDGAGVLEPFGELLGGFEGPAGCFMLVGTLIK
jgi:hypothetical protein